MRDILYLNDNELLLVRSGRAEYSQGYAWIRDDQVLFDGDPTHSAVKHCRLAPQQINTRYWQQCDESSLPANPAGVRHAADLIWKHLAELRRRFEIQELVLVTPSHYQAHNLQLLLGIAQACEIQISAVLNGPVLLLHHARVKDGRYQHIDMQLNQTVISEVRVSDGLVRLHGVEVRHEMSLQTLQDALLKSMQNNFIQNDRFDPLHYAATEQQLFDQIPAAAAAIARDGKTSLLIEHQGRTHNVAIDAPQWQETLRPWFEKLSLGNAAGFDAQYLQVNGLVGSAVQSLPEMSGVKSLQPSAEIKIPADVVWRDANNELVYVNELQFAVNVKDGATVSPNTSQPTSRATHLLSAGMAVPLAKGAVSMQANQLSIATVGEGEGNVLALLKAGQLFILNDPERHQLEPNDRLGSNFADGVLTVINVIE